jgi:gamma-glutamylcyclotransferase
VTEISERIQVFAYGSNLSVARIARRVARVEVVATGTVRGYALRFNKRSSDGSAKANAHHTGAIDDLVWGAVYALDAADKKSLDGFEGLGRGYFEAEVDVETSAGAQIQAWLYSANPEHVAEGIAPYVWYHRFCLEGAREHGFPDFYLEAIAATPAIPDPDPNRHDRESATLDGERR